MLSSHPLERGFHSDSQSHAAASPIVLFLILILSLMHRLTLLTFVLPGTRALP